MDFEEVLLYASFLGAATGGAVRYAVNGTDESRKDYLFLVIYSGLIGFGIVCCFDFYLPSMEGKHFLGLGILIGLCGPEQLIFFNMVCEGAKEIWAAYVNKIVGGIKRRKKRGGDER